MTKEEFIKKYTEGIDISEVAYNYFFITLPCNCGERGCDGWACVLNNENSIRRHRELYG